MVEENETETVNGQNTLFDYSRDCVWCVNGRCMDLLSGNGRKNCDGTKKCRLPWRDDGWVTYNVKKGKE